MDDTQGARKQARRKQEAFFKRRRSFIKKAHELYSIYQADVYVVIRHKNKFYTYTSKVQHQNWPPSEKAIVRFLNPCEDIPADPA